tara:strand:+ start:71266 stop:71478 length:213 start_codon:yes stop_codon:yes gene_type:complete
MALYISFFRHFRLNKIYKLNIETNYQNKTFFDARSNKYVVKNNSAMQNPLSPGNIMMDIIYNEIICLKQM